MTDTRNVSPPRFGWRRRCAGVRLNHSVSPGSLASLSVRTRPHLDQDLNCPAHRADRLGASWLHEFAASVFSHTTLFLRNSKAIIEPIFESGLRVPDAHIRCNDSGSAWVSVLRKTMRAIANGKDEPVPVTIEDASVLDALTPVLRDRQ
jgi:hypothetical protein